eukprot:8226335-Heterocapsa_arctica.AAC.1
MEVERGKRNITEAVDPRIALRHEKDELAARLNVLEEQERSMTTGTVHPADEVAHRIMMRWRKENAASSS